MAAAVEILKESTKIEKIIGSTISVEAYDHSPQRAADIANEYAKQLHFLAEKYHFVPPKILDTAVPQYLPAKPRISLIVLGILFGCLLANVVVIYLNCFIRDLKEHHPDDFERLLFVQAVVRNDLQKLIFWRKSKDGRKPQTKNHLTSYLAYQPSLASGLLEPKREDGVEV